MPAAVDFVSQAAPADWRSRERSRQSIAHQLHRAAAADLACAEPLWALVPADGPVDDLLSARHQTAVPSIHLSRAAARLAVWACIAEMATRRGAIGWVDDSLSELIASHQDELPDLAESWRVPIAESLPRLSAAAGALEQVPDDELARLTGRTYEFGLTTSWIFRDRTAPPERVWHVWRAKQSGCFFTPEFVARHLAAVAINEQTATVLDPAVGAGAFLVEAYLRFAELGVDDAAERLYGVDLDGSLCDLSAAVVAFLAGDVMDGGLSTRGHFVKGDSLLASVHGAAPGSRWSDWFPGQIEFGGFDVVLMNPPYVQLKVNHSSLPARPGDSDEAAEFRKAGLAQARDAAQELSERLRAHPDFRYAHGGVPDLPRFFVERALSLLREGGRLACIVPSTFLADHRSKGVRRHLLTDHTVQELDLIPEDARLFADVNQPTCLLVVDKGRSSDIPIRLRTGIDSPAALQSTRSSSVSPRLLHAVDPGELRVPNCEPEDWDILALLHENPSIHDHDWVENLRGELDLTLDRDFISASPTRVPLVRGDQVERFTSSLASDKPRWVVPVFLDSRVSARKLAHFERIRVVGRQCSYLKKPRRLSFAMIEPRCVVANSCNYLVVQAGDVTALSKYLTGALNSTVLEWRFRLTSSTNHVGNYELDALPLPTPNPKLVERVCQLVDRLLADPANEAADRELDEVWFDAYGLRPGDRERLERALRR
ncbi:MAG: N-6 DNA methylase [Actinomycetota bacterium]|nr:N-6 DNA methylase [Actinomycetota bacterium]